MEKEEILDYTAIPDFSKLGFEIMAFSFYSWQIEATEELTKNREMIRVKLSKFLSEHKNIIFTSNGQGFGMERMMISVHESYSDYVKLKHDVLQVWGRYLSQSNSFIISLKEDVVGRQLGFSVFGEYLLQKR